MKFRLIYRFAPLAIFAAVFIMQVILANPRWGGPGLTWDETYYVDPFEATAGWTAQLVSYPMEALAPDAIFAAWEPINELPPLLKWIGAGLISLPAEGWNKLWMIRLASCLFYAATVSLLYLIARRHIRGWWAFLPALLYLLHPRIMAHGQLAATETLFAFITVLTIWVAGFPWSGWRKATPLVFCVALAVATKINAVIIIIALVAWLLTGRLLSRRGILPTIANVYTTGLVALAAPILAFLIWPWMWIAPVEHGVFYWNFFLKHPLQGMWYMGEKWNFNAPPVPMTYPVVISHLVTPIGLLVLFWAGAIGVWIRLATARRIPLAVQLWGLLLLGPIAASSLPNTPRYDGIRLFIPAFAPAALLAGWGIWQIRLIYFRRRTIKPLGAAVILFIVLSIPTTRGTLHYYNPIADLMNRGPVYPFEVTYWGEGITPDFVEDLNRDLPPNTKIKTLALMGPTFTLLQRWDLLRGDLDFISDPPYDVHLMQNRKGFWGNAEWSIYAGREPLSVWGEGPGGEPLIFLYDGRPPGL